MVFLYGGYEGVALSVGKVRKSLTIMLDGFFLMEKGRCIITVHEPRLKYMLVHL